MLECPMYADLRVKYFRADLQEPNEYNFKRLFNLKDPYEISRVAAFVHNSFKRREALIDN